MHVLHFVGHFFQLYILFLITEIDLIVCQFLKTCHMRTAFIRKQALAVHVLASITMTAALAFFINVLFIIDHYLLQ